MARLKDDKSVVFLVSAGRAIQQQRNLCLQTLSWCEGCRIRSSVHKTLLCIRQRNFSKLKLLYEQLDKKRASHRRVPHN